VNCAIIISHFLILFILFLLSLTTPSSHQSNLVGNQLISIPSELGNLSSLCELRLDGNQLTIIPSELCNLSSLRKLCDNHFSFPFIHSPYLFLSDLYSSHPSYLHSNILKSLPSELGNLSSLRVLCDNHFLLQCLLLFILFLLSLTTPSSHQSDLNHNQLTIIPSELGNLSSLRILCDNHFSFSNNIIHSISHISDHPFFSSKLSL